MSAINRREFLQMAAAIGATAVWGDPFATVPGGPWQERRDLFPEGVASGDPDSHSVILWTRRPPAGNKAVSNLRVEVAEDEQFRRVVASSMARDIGGLRLDVPGPRGRAETGASLLVPVHRRRRAREPDRTDDDGAGQRRSAPGAIRFRVCQNVNDGAQNAYRRMIYEDERAPEQDRLGFMLHLGDFIYEIVWYPEDRPQGMYDRTLRDIVSIRRARRSRTSTSRRTSTITAPSIAPICSDPDLQDARARWPFVNMWDNHEFSWLGWQSLQKFDGMTRPAQTRKVAANQAFFEFQPARLIKPSGPSLERFDPPHVVDAPITQFDDHGLGQEPNNLRARQPHRLSRAALGTQRRAHRHRSAQLSLGRADRAAGGEGVAERTTFRS